jgi:hypothetical protein
MAISSFQLQLCAARIIQVKREKNVALQNEQRSAKYRLLVTMKEFESELLGSKVNANGDTIRSLEQAVLDAVKSRKLLRCDGGFCPPDVMRDSREKAEKHWAQNTTEPIRE